jgi:hypothetical protein
MAGRAGRAYLPDMQTRLPNSKVEKWLCFNPRFYWAAGAPFRGDYYATTCTWTELAGATDRVEYQLFRLESRELHLVDRHVVPASRRRPTDPISQDQLHEQGRRLAEGCLIYDLVLVGITAWPMLETIDEELCLDRLATAAGPFSLILLAENSRCDNIPSFRHRLLTRIGAPMEGEKAFQA